MSPRYDADVAAARQPRVPLPKGRHAAPRAVVVASQRERLLEGMAEAVAEKGYARTAVADVLSRAGVSRKAFYEHFANKEECFLAAYDFGTDDLLRAIDAAYAADPDPLGGVVAASRAYLEELTARPAFARTYLVEVLGAGPEALRRRSVVHARFAAQLARIYDAARAALPGLPDPVPARFRAAVGAVNELTVDHLLHHGPETLPELLGAVVDVEIALLVGHDRLAAVLDSGGN